MWTFSYCCFFGNWRIVHNTFVQTGKSGGRFPSRWSPGVWFKIPGSWDKDWKLSNLLLKERWIFLNFDVGKGTLEPIQKPNLLLIRLEHPSWVLLSSKLNPLGLLTTRAKMTVVWFEYCFVGWPHQYEPFIPL